MTKKLHIISFSIPYPADYGGVIDVFYKLKFLSQSGVQITLHCFQYDREPAKELEEFCQKVYYYPRQMKGSHLLGFHPFIVSSRKSEDLIQNLLKDDAPILYEGLHTCFSINDERLKDRKKIVRSHNIEHDYYAALAKVERNPMKKLYFKSEAKKLKRFEEVAYKNASLVLGISQNDTVYLNKYGNAKFISAFHSFDEIDIPQQTKPFALYHGNLSVGENNEAAIFLADKVFRGLNHQLIIAGNQPSLKLKKLAAELPNVELKAGLSSNEINDLIHSAQINVLPTFQSTGIKLKLLAALFTGGHCLVNNSMVPDDSFKSILNIANTIEEFKQKIEELMSENLSSSVNENRKEVLTAYSNSSIAKELLKLLKFN